MVGGAEPGAPVYAEVRGGTREHPAFDQGLTFLSGLHTALCVAGLALVIVAELAAVLFRDGRTVAREADPRRSRTARR